MSTVAIAIQSPTSLQAQDLIAILNQEARELEKIAWGLDAEAVELRNRAEILQHKEDGSCQRCRFHIVKDTIRWNGACGTDVHLAWCCMDFCRFTAREEVVP